MRQIKMLLLVGIVVLLTACGGGSSGSSGSGSSGVVDDGSNTTVATPAEILEQALYAQANGDIDGFLSKCALKGQSQQDIDQTRSLFKSVDDQITFSNFSFEPVALGIYGEGDLAVVRAITSFTINGDYQERSGVLSYLKKEDGQWKILRIFPDTYLDLEIDEEAELSSASNNIHALKKDYAAGNPRQMKEINAALNQIISNPDNNPELKMHIDEFSAIWTGGFAGVGAMQTLPTETIAYIEQLASVLKDTVDAIKELKNTGFSGIATAKIMEVKIGILRIGFEYDVIAGAYFDLKSVILHQLTYTLEIQRAARQLRAILHDGKSVDGFSITEEAYLQPYANIYEQMGVSVELYADDSYPLPAVRSINIKKPEAFGYTLPFRVVGVLSYRYEKEYGGINAVAELMSMLGGKPGKSQLAIPEIITDEMLLEVDLRSWVEKVETSGNEIINFTNNLKTSDLTMGNFGTITCRRDPLSLFTVQLRNGISTPEVTVTSFMNSVNALEISEAYQKGITVSVDNTISNIKIYGNYKDNGGVDQKVDLTPKSFNINANMGDYHTAAFFRSSPNVCLDMKIEDTSIASLKRYEDISIGGLKEGSTKLIVNLAGSPVEINLEVPVTVGEGETYKGSMEINPYNNWWPFYSFTVVREAQWSLNANTNIVAYTVNEDDIIPLFRIRTEPWTSQKNPAGTFKIILSNNATEGSIISDIDDNKCTIGKSYYVLTDNTYTEDGWLKFEVQLNENIISGSYELQEVRTTGGPINFSFKLKIPYTCEDGYSDILEDEGTIVTIGSLDK